MTAALARREEIVERRSADRLNLKYRVDKLLAEGGMGLLVRAENRVTGQKVAIKLLNTQGASRPELVQRFQHEGPIAMRVRHPNVIRVHETGTHDDLPYIVMEYLEGEPLSFRIAAGKVAVEEAIRITLDILNGLSAVHRSRIVHRDIKPDNIFLHKQPDGSVRAKILDFGIALDQRQGSQDHVVAGTPAFMAPEQARGEEVDGRTDVYSVGVILYELLSGVPPYSGNTPEEVIRASLERKHKPLAEVAPHLPAELIEVVDRAMAFEPEDRFQTATEFAMLLTYSLRRLPVEVSNAATMEGSQYNRESAKTRTPSRLSQFIATYVTKK